MLSKMSPEELELMSYTDIAYALLKEEKKTMNIATIFKKVCDLLEYSEDDFSSKIGDFYTSMNIDKRFVLLDNNEWDVRDNHSIKVELEEDDDDEIIDEEIEEEVEEEIEENDDTLYDDENEIDDDDDIDDLSIISDDEMDEE